MDELYLERESELDEFFENADLETLKGKLDSMTCREKAFLFQMYLKKDSYRRCLSQCLGEESFLRILKEELTPPMKLTELEKLVTRLIYGKM